MAAVSERLTNVVSANGASFEDATTVIQANQFPVRSVKLFRSGGAEVTRTFSLSSLRSQDTPQVVEIVHLPADLQSVDVSASTNLTILDHYHATQPRAAPSSQTLKELQAEQQRLEDEKKLRQQSFGFLTTLMESLAQGKGRHLQEAAQLVSFFDDFVETGIARSALVAELDGKIADVGRKIAEETQRLSKLDGDLPVKVVTALVYDSNVPVEAPELTLSYVVNQVSCKPEYDLHVSTAGDTPSPTVKLDVRCSVKQWTGENWENVSLALTAGDRMSQLIRLPEPKRVGINLSPTPKSVFANNAVWPPEKPFQPSPFFPASSLNDPTPGGSNFAVYGALRDAERLDGVETQTTTLNDPLIGPFGVGVSSTHELTRTSEPPKSPQNPLSPSNRTELPRDNQVGSLQVLRKGLEEAQKHYGVNGWAPQAASGELPTGESQTRNDVPEANRLSATGSDSNFNYMNTHIDGSVFMDHTVHHFLAASLPLETEFVRVAVPSVDDRVYYICKVKNVSEYGLPPGTVKAFLNGKHVSSTEIHNTESPQILECPIGVDTDIKVTYSHSPDGFSFTSVFTGNVTRSYRGSTVIHNAHKDVIRDVVVRSAIAVPVDPRITIVHKQPRGLSEIDEGSVSVKEGCVARWSTTGGGKQAGLFEWVCDVPGLGTEELTAIWEVSVPKDFKIIEQEHS